MQKDKQHSKLLFFNNKYTLWHIRLNICKQKTKFSSHKQYLLDLLFSRNAKKSCADQNTLQTFLLCLKKNASQTPKSSSCKKVFPECVYHWYNLLWCIFSTLCDNWKALLFIQFYRYPEIWYNQHMLCFLKWVFWKKSAFSIFIICQ